MTALSKLNDAFGVPSNVLRLSDQFYGGLGRVAALGAIVELRMSDIVVLWGGETSDAGKPIHYLMGRFREITKARRDADQDVPEGLNRVVAEARAVMKERNELIHSLWPGNSDGETDPVVQRRRFISESQLSRP